jgi:hypothetical protein
MLTVLSRLKAPLTAPILHQIFKAFEALTVFMAYFLTDMTASKRVATRLTATWWICMTFNHIISLLAAVAGLSDWLKAWWAVSKMAFERAFVTARQYLRARIVACWLDCSALDWRIDSSSTTWAVEWVSGVDFAWFAVSNMAVFTADMLST